MKDPLQIFLAVVSVSEQKHLLCYSVLHQDEDLIPRGEYWGVFKGVIIASDGRSPQLWGLITPAINIQGTVTHKDDRFSTLLYSDRNTAERYYQKIKGAVEMFNHSILRYSPTVKPNLPPTIVSIVGKDE